MKITATTRNADPQLMAWDTEFWGVRVGRATNLDGVGEWAVENTVGLVCLLIDANDTAQIQEATASGFRYMDTRVTLARRTASAGTGARLLALDDLPVLRSIARTAFRQTRFYADPVLADARCDDLYEEWARSSFAGAADITLVSDRDKSPVGFITVSLDKETASIGLIAVAADYRGTGVGSELVSSSVNWAKGQQAKEMTVVTQGRNIGALRTFESCGFRITKMEQWLHRWYEGG